MFRHVKMPNFDQTWLAQPVKNKVIQNLTIESGKDHPNAITCEMNLWFFITFKNLKKYIAQKQNIFSHKR